MVEVLNLLVGRKYLLDRGSVMYIRESMTDVAGYEIRLKDGSFLIVSKQDAEKIASRAITF